MGTVAHWDPRCVEVRPTPSLSVLPPGYRCPGTLLGKRLKPLLWVAGDQVILSGRYVIKFFSLKVILQKGDQGRMAEGDEEGQNAGKRTHKSHMM